MKLLELARLWIHPSVQNLTTEDRYGKTHSLTVASCAMGKSIKRVQEDWYMKYPNLPKIDVDEKVLDKAFAFIRESGQEQFKNNEKEAI